MDDSKRNVLVTFTRRGGRRNIYILSLAIAALVGVAGFLLLPSNNVGTVSARGQENGTDAAARLERSLDFALDFKTAGDAKAFGKQVRASQNSDTGNLVDRNNTMGRIRMQLLPNCRARI